MGYQDAIASIGIATTVDNKPSNGTVDGVDSFDTKTYASVDPATKPEISETDESAKYAGNNPDWGVTNSYGNNDYAYEVARNSLSQNTYGTNPFSSNDFSRMLYGEQGIGTKLFGIA